MAAEGAADRKAYDVGDRLPSSFCRMQNSSTGLVPYPLGFSGDPKSIPLPCLYIFKREELQIVLTPMTTQVKLVSTFIIKCKWSKVYLN